MKRGKHNPQACKTLSSTNQTKKMSVVLLSNCYDPRVVKGIERQVKELKVKEKVSCPIGIEQYKEFLREVDLSDQMYVSDQVGR